MNKLLTIIVPTYNMEKYLNRCLDSLIIEKYLDKLEVLIINDGSKDRSSEIAHKYQHNYPDVFRVIDKENGNYGSCVNRGLKEATGKYLRILDADDCFNKEALLYLIDYIKKQDYVSDIIVTNYQEDYIHTNKIKKRVAKDVKYEKIYFLKDLDLRKQLVFVMHGITYKKEILDACGLYHQEGISYTDSEYCFYPLTQAKTIIFLNKVLYRYQIGREEQTVSEKSYQKNINQVYMIIDRMLSFIENNKSNYHSHILRNQKKILFNCFKVYYSIILTTKFVHTENLKLLDERIHNLNYEMFLELGRMTYLKMPIVQIWRKLGLCADNSNVYILMFKFLKYLSRF